MQKTTKDVVDLLKDRLDITMTVQNVDQSYRYAKKWRRIISYLRVRFLNNISRIPIANKAHRLYILNEAVAESLKWRVKSVSQFGKVEAQKIGLIPALMREARAEVEGDKPAVKINIENQKNVFQDIKVEQKIGDLARDINNRLSAQFSRKP